MKSSNKASMSFIFVTIFLEWLGMGIIIPILPDVIRRFNSDPSFVNHYFGYFVSVYALMQFLASPVLGSLADRFGRRPVLLSSLIGSSADYILMALAPNLTLLFLGRVISGLTGAGMTVASSYIADISNDENRSANFGLIGAAFGLGFIVGPVIGGSFGTLSPHMPFYIAAALNFVNFIFGLFILPESLPPENRRPLKWNGLNPFASLSKIFRPSPILALVWVAVLTSLAGQSHPSIWTLYTQHKFQWTALQVGASLTFVGVVVALAQGGLSRLLIPRLGKPRSLLFGIVIYIVSFALFAWVTEGWMMYAVMVVFAFSGVASPALQSMITKSVPADQQGELQGSLVAIGSFTAVIGPLLYTGLFTQFTTKTNGIYFPGIAYLTASIICVVALGISVLNAIPRQQRPR